MAGKFEVYEDRSGGFRVRLKASNGQVVAVNADVATQTTGSYATKAAAKKGCAAIEQAAVGATVVDVES